MGPVVPTIALDLRWMRLGAAGGVEQATRSLIDGLARLDRTNCYRLHCRRAAYFEWRFPSEFRHEARFSDGVEQELYRLRGIDSTDPEPADLSFFPTGFTPASPQCPFVATVHDLQHLHHPNFFSVEEHAERATSLARLATAASRVLCISEFTKNDLLAHHPSLADRVTVAPPTVAPRPPPPPRVRAKLLGALGVRQPYLLYPAHAWPHKNHLRALAAWRLALPGLPRQTRLVLTGRPPEAGSALDVALAEARARDRVTHLGYRTPLEMDALMADAEGLFFPSLFEGYGLPVAEAILVGLPVACSRTTSLPEVADEAALFFHPESETDMAEAISRLIGDERLRSELREKSLARAPRLDPLRGAAATLDAFHHALGTPRPPLKPRPPVRAGFAHLRACHHARHAEEAGGRGRLVAALGGFLGTLLWSPRLAWRRLGIAACVRLEVVLRRALRASPICSR